MQFSNILDIYIYLSIDVVFLFADGKIILLYNEDVASSSDHRCSSANIVVRVGYIAKDGFFLFPVNRNLS